MAVADLDPETKRQITEMHEAIIEQKTLIDNVVVNRDACEQKRKEIFEVIKDCAETQCEKIKEAGKAGKTAMILAGAVGSMIAIVIIIVVYLLTRG